MAYDKSKNTEAKDVKREVSEAVEAVKDVFQSEGTVKQAGEQLAEAAAASADFVADKVDSAVRYFRSKLGYQLSDPGTGAVVTPAPSAAVPSEWTKEQVEKGLIEEVEAPKE